MIIVGDIHGDIVRMQQIVHLAGPEKMIFVGDFLDSFRYDIEDQIKCVDFALRLVEDERAVVIRGNHELSYMSPYCVCSGYSAFTKTLLEENKRLSRMNELFVDFVYLKDKNLLITHAGLNSVFAKEFSIDATNVEERLTEMAGLDYKTSPLFHAGRARGGSSKTGGIFWSDWHREHSSVKGLRQVFGHTVIHEIEAIGDDWNIDCLQYSDQVLRYDENADTFALVEF